ncbi:hypothetical protein [Parvibacter caecicola]|nr:hypothetical protein [Parvibacter caecicola]
MGHQRDITYYQRVATASGKTFGRERAMGCRGCLVGVAIAPSRG